MRAQPVDLALVLAIDVSESVNQQEYRMQVEGLAEAFRAPEVSAAIRNGPHGAIAVSVVLWAGSFDQRVALPWTRIAGADSAHDLAVTLDSLPRLGTRGATAIGAALLYSARQFNRLPMNADRLVIDVSGDGRSNTGPALDPARQHLASQGITVNGLAIETDYDWLGVYFDLRVKTGFGAFVEVAHNFEDYRRAIRRKLLREIRPPLIAGPPARLRHLASLPPIGHGACRIAPRRGSKTAMPVNASCPPATAGARP